MELRHIEIDKLTVSTANIRGKGKAPDLNNILLDAIVAETAGAEAAVANARATGKVKRSIIRDGLNGENGRAKVEGFVPRWMAFPPSAYTERGGVGTVTRANQIASVAGIVVARPGAPGEPEAPVEAVATEPMAEAA